MVAIRIENLSKRYRLGTIGGLPGSWLKFPWSKASRSRNEHWALKDVCFEVEQGQVLGVLGKNGAGKSTLLKILSRITRPTSGRILARGNVASLLEVGTGFHPELTGRENVFLNGAILGMKGPEIRSKFSEIVEFSGIKDFIDTPVKRYSSGMYVRLAFAVAAHLESQIIVLDEVLAVGDAEFQRKCFDKMSSIAKDQGRTVLFVSHNLSAVLELCNVGVYLEKGSLKGEGSMEEVAALYYRDTKFSNSLGLAVRDDRYGNGRLQFANVTLHDEHGEALDYFVTGRAARLRLHFRLEKEVCQAQVMVACGINNQQGVRITNLYNAATGQIFQQLERDMCCFEIRIAKLPLMPGNYSSSLYCAVGEEVADFVQEAFEFTVAPGDFFDSGRLLPPGQGDFLVECDFVIKRESEA